MDVREHGGFREEARALVPQDADYALGYRHMVTGCLHPPEFRTEWHSLLTVAFRPFLQCHFMSMVWFRALQGYDYAMRVDEE
jgi:hypothetical protein|eukprot:1456863-Prymnesium_polylepis.1